MSPHDSVWEPQFTEGFGGVILIYNYFILKYSEENFHQYGFH